MRILIAGCGDLGNRLAARGGDREYHGLRRSPENLPRTVHGHAGDLSRPESLQTVAGSWDAVVYTATPDARTPEAYRAAYVAGLEHLLDAVTAHRLIFVSSTAVYGQDTGQWVDESSETVPARFNGEILLAAEARVRAAGGVVVRFSGIYGPGRDGLVRMARSGNLRCRREPPVWTNRIHADDCAAVLDHLIGLADPAPLYCASDRCPAPRWEVLSWLAERLGVAGPEEADQDSGQGRRVDARRLYNSGLRLCYPDYRAGYAAVLAAAESSGPANS